MSHNLYLHYRRRRGAPGRLPTSRFSTRRPRLWAADRQACAPLYRVILQMLIFVPERNVGKYRRYSGAFRVGLG